MAKPKMLFVDDRTKRIHYAIEELGKIYDVTIAANVPEALRLLSQREWDIVSLDHDLDGHDYNDFDSVSSGMRIVDYIIDSEWAKTKPDVPKFIIHSSNEFGAIKMARKLNSCPKIQARIDPITYKPISENNGFGRYKIGLVAGAFDVIHPGYIFMLEDAKRHCDYLIVAIHADPSVERPSKMRPVLLTELRMRIANSIRYVDKVEWYQTEEDLRTMIRADAVDILIVGSDWVGRNVTGSELVSEIYYHNRDHDWSATKFKKMIAESLK